MENVTLSRKTDQKIEKAEKSVKPEKISEDINMLISGMIIIIRS